MLIYTVKRALLKSRVSVSGFTVDGPVGSEEGM